jgi:23S rRNA (guanosine2251-2'-O)-methyltransferase
MQRDIILIAHNLRSCHNVGSILRTAEGLGVKKVCLTGYTPYPASNNDKRMPHIVAKIDRQIQKTALGAEKTVDWEHEESVSDVINNLKAEGFQVIALEQTENSFPLAAFKTPEKIALIVGREVEGIEQEVLRLCDQAVEIPMLGKKESFNVVQAAAMALYHMRFA